MSSAALAIVNKIKSNKGIALIIILALALRTIYGMCINFDEFNIRYYQDYTQIYLLGLKSYTTNTWPYWGPDITYTSSQMPGAMQGLLVGLPFYIFQSPLAPFIFLNVLSVSALVFFAWYISKRISGVPKWFIYAWLLTAPWTTNYSTTVVNPSYVLAPAILFFIGIIELLPIYEKKTLPVNLSFFFLGFSMGWILQIYMAWVLLPFYVLLVLFFFLLKKNYKIALTGIVFFVLGLALTLSLLIPTFLKYGFVTGGSESAIVLNLSNLKNIDVLTRFIAFSTYEAFHFMSGALVNENTLLFKYMWATPFILILFAIGIAQTLYYLTFFFRRTDHPEFKYVKLLTLGSIVLIFISYLFTVRGMASYTFYIFVPVSFWFSFYCLEPLFKKLFWKKFAVFVLLSGLVYHTALATGFYDSNSLFVRYNSIDLALKNKDSRLFTYRRVADWEQDERQKGWTKKTVIDQADTILAFDNNFDTYSADILPESLNKEYFVTAPYSCAVDSMNDFSLSFSKKIKEMGGKRKISISLFSKCAELHEAALIVTVFNKEKSFFWWSSKLISNESKTGVWNEHSFSTLLPEINDPDAKLEIYVALPKTNKNPLVFVDNFRVELR